MFFQAVVLSDPKSKLVPMLLEKGADVNAKDKSGRTALFLAASSANLHSVQVLLDLGADVDARTDTGQQGGGSTPLMAVSETDNPDSTKIVELPISKGADVNANPASAGGG
ncbi:ankyrin repeat domain-containing protein [bacterium CPR1]|nr:ankyrin repeat domain-containing protein [bacterium CPR1]